MSQLWKALNWNVSICEDDDDDDDDDEDDDGQVDDDHPCDDPPDDDIHHVGGHDVCKLMMIINVMVKMMIINTEIMFNTMIPR